MANEQNLTHALTTSEQRAGGIASGKARREKKRLREIAQMILDEDYTQDGHTMTAGEAMMRVQFRKALREGDLKSAEFIRDTAGQRPAQGVDINGTIATDQARFSELWEQLREARE